MRHNERRARHFRARAGGVRERGRCCAASFGVPGLATVAGLLFLIESDEALEFNRKELGLKPAVWYGMFTGGLCGRIDTFDKDRVRIVEQ